LLQEEIPNIGTEYHVIDIELAVSLQKLMLYVWKGNFTTSIRNPEIFQHTLNNEGSEIADVVGYIKKNCAFLRVFWNYAEFYWSYRNPFSGTEHLDTNQ